MARRRIAVARAVASAFRAGQVRLKPDAPDSLRGRLQWRFYRVRELRVSDERALDATDRHPKRRQPLLDERVLRHLAGDVGAARGGDDPAVRPEDRDGD